MLLLFLCIKNNFLKENEDIEKLKTELDNVCRHELMDANETSNLFVSMWLRFLIVVHIDDI